jgi:hypothetical protein
MMPLDGARVSDPHCGQDDRADDRDEEGFHDSYSYSNFTPELYQRYMSRAVAHQLVYSFAL